MCPTFVATGEEIMSTRGRANVIRAAFVKGFGDSAASITPDRSRSPGTASNPDSISLRTHTAFSGVISTCSWFAAGVYTASNGVCESRFGSPGKL